MALKDKMSMCMSETTGQGDLRGSALTRREPDKGGIEILQNGSPKLDPDSKSIIEFKLLKELFEHRVARFNKSPKWTPINLKSTRILHLERFDQYRLVIEANNNEFQVTGDNWGIPLKIMHKAFPDMHDGLYTLLYRMTNNAAGLMEFPVTINNRMLGVEASTVNVSRGCTIWDRIDYTLALIRGYYLRQEPLVTLRELDKYVTVTPQDVQNILTFSNVLNKNTEWFNLFGSWDGFLDFYELAPFVREDKTVKPLTSWSQVYPVSSYGNYVLNLMSALKKREDIMNCRYK